MITDGQARNPGSNPTTPWTTRVYMQMIQPYSRFARHFVFCERRALMM